MVVFLQYIKMIKFQTTQNQKHSTIMKPELISSISEGHCYPITDQQGISCSKIHDKNQHDTTSTIYSLIGSTPNKIYQNCQRTARVIMLSQLQKMIGKDRKLKHQLCKNMNAIVPYKNKSADSQLEYNRKNNYSKNLPYSRVNIGQKYFINNILHNPVFRQKFQIIFQQQSYQKCQKARKNENSQISLQNRKKIITFIIEEYKKSFKKFYSNCRQQKKPQYSEIMKTIIQEEIEIKIEQYKQSVNYLIEQQIARRMYYYMMPMMVYPPPIINCQGYYQKQNNQQ